MIANIRNLKKLDDILNSEGTILGLYKYNDKHYLGSYLKNKSGTVYYSVNEPMLTRYFNNELRLQEVFLACEDIVVPPNFRKGPVDLVKEQLAKLLTCGERLFIENSAGMRNDTLVGQFTNRN